MIKKVKIRKKNRICKYFDCKTTLNIYNPERYCYIHQRAIAQELPTKAALAFIS